MAKTELTTGNKVGVGIYKLDEKSYMYRISVKRNGNRYDTTRKTDKDTGKPFTSKSAAERARAKELYEIELENKKIPKKKVTVDEIFNYYLRNSALDKAQSTITKQKSVYKNHIKEVFGDTNVSDLAVQDVQDFLSDKYNNTDLKYSYIESFLKFFYLIVNQANNRNLISTETYNKLCVNPGTKMVMPKRRIDDEEEDVRVFTENEVKIIRAVVKDSNAELAMLLGLEMQLRIAEVYGLTWDNIDFENRMISVEKQMLRTDGIFTCGPLKTSKAKRKIHMTDRVYDYLVEHKKNLDKAIKEKPLLFEQKNVTVPWEDGRGHVYKKLHLTDFIHTTTTAEFQTFHSFKYWAQAIRDKGRIEFKFHWLRHTGASLLADLNTPIHLLCNRLGHRKIETTYKYYTGMTEKGVEILKGNLDKIFGTSGL